METTAPGSPATVIPVSYTHLDVYKRQLLFLAAGCGKRGADSSGTTGSGTTSAGGSNTAAADTMDVDFSSRDMDVGYNEAESTSITFGSGGIVITGGGASAADSTVTITGAGTYIPVSYTHLIRL